MATDAISEFLDKSEQAEKEFRLHVFGSRQAMRDTQNFPTALKLRCPFLSPG